MPFPDQICLQTSQTWELRTSKVGLERNCSRAKKKGSLNKQFAVIIITSFSPRFSLGWWLSFQKRTRVLEDFVRLSDIVEQMDTLLNTKSLLGVQKRKNIKVNIAWEWLLQASVTYVAHLKKSLYTQSLSFFPSIHELFVLARFTSPVYQPIIELQQQANTALRAAMLRKKLSILKVYKCFPWATVLQGFSLSNFVSRWNNFSPESQGSIQPGQVTTGHLRKPWSNLEQRPRIPK